jgi:HAD superfamily hydrolase (TIGR01490 family)
MKRKVAIFDIDGTIFRSSLLIELVERLIGEGALPERTRHAYLRAQERWLDRVGNYDDYIAAVISAFDAGLKRVTRQALERASEHVIKLHGRRVYRFTRQLTSDLKRRGYFLVAISHSPKFILDRFCRQWGFDKVYGRIYEFQPNGHPTGKVEYLDQISDKAKILKRVVARDGLTLKGSVGVGDSEADIRFLRLVEHPICFNPNSKLLTAAKRRGWRVVVERKDAIYEM